MLEDFTSKVFSEYGLAMTLLLMAVVYLLHAKQKVEGRMQAQSQEHMCRYLKLLERTITTMEQSRSTIERLAERIR